MPGPVPSGVKPFQSVSFVYVRHDSRYAVFGLMTGISSFTDRPAQMNWNADSEDAPADMGANSSSVLIFTPAFLSAVRQVFFPPVDPGPKSMTLVWHTKIVSIDQSLVNQVEIRNTTQNWSFSASYDDASEVAILDLPGDVYPDLFDATWKVSLDQLVDMTDVEYCLSWTLTFTT